MHGRKSTVAPALGKAGVAFVVPRDTAPTEDDLRAWCRDRLAAYKIPPESSPLTNCRAGYRQGVQGPAARRGIRFELVTVDTLAESYRTVPFAWPIGRECLERNRNRAQLN